MPDNDTIRPRSKTTHVLLVDERRDGGGISLYSPQLPGLAFGRATEAEFRADFEEALHRVGVHGNIESHREYLSTLPDGQEYSVRWATAPEHLDERLIVATNLIGTLEADPDRLLDDERSVSPDGILRFVCALPADRLGWLVEQMDPRGEVLTVCTMVTDQMIFGTTIATEGAAFAAGWPETSEFGWSPATTVAEMMTSLAKSPERRRVTVAA